MEIQELKGRMTTVEGKKGGQGPSDMATDPAQEASKKRVGWVRNEGDGVWGPPLPSPSPNDSGNGSFGNSSPGAAASASMPGPGAGV
eukprot:10033970-Heterocapsa_arctica.AAC.1